MAEYYLKHHSKSARGRLPTYWNKESLVCLVTSTNFINIETAAIWFRDILCEGDTHFERHQHMDLRVFKFFDYGRLRQVIFYSASQIFWNFQEKRCWLSGKRWQSELWMQYHGNWLFDIDMQSVQLRHSTLSWHRRPADTVVWQKWSDEKVRKQSHNKGTSLTSKKNGASKRTLAVTTVALT